MKTFRHIFRLIKAGWVLTITGAGLPPLLRQSLPFWVRLFLPGRHRSSARNPAPLSAAFSKLGPTYIKLGQFLAVRRDLLDKDYAEDLSQLHDRLPSFSQAEAEGELRRNFTFLPFTEFSDAIAAASIAQVHKARGQDGRHYAVKILRPQIEKRFMRDLESMFWAARKIERYLPNARRLHPVAALENLRATTQREMDLRLEAAAMSELAENSVSLDAIYVPRPNWRWTTARVLTVEWVEGIAIHQIDRLKEAGHDLRALAKNLLQIFLTHALRDGFFHADFHPGNLFVRADGVIVPVDFGIMGRLSTGDRRAMAWILHGLIKGDYRLAARQHIDIGYVPPDTDEALFAQSLRALGEPILDKSAQEISMADLLWRLFETAARFKMETQPQLLLLQKTMVSTEGLARQLDPNLNIWQIAAPVIEAWMRAEYALPRLASEVGQLAQKLWSVAPSWLEAERAARTARALGAASSAAQQDEPHRIYRWRYFWLGVLSTLTLGIIAALIALAGNRGVLDILGAIFVG